MAERLMVSGPRIKVLNSWSRCRRLTSGPQLTGRQRKAFVPSSRLFPLLLLQTVLAGCMISENTVDLPGVDTWSLYLLVVAVLFILLSAGVHILNSKLGSYLPPVDRMGRIFLAVLGVSMLLFVGWQQWRRMSTGDPSLIEELKTHEESRASEAPVDPVDPADRSLSGRVSFGEYESIFEKYYSKLTIHVVGEDMGVKVRRDGFFSIDLPVSTPTPVKITWRGDDLDRNYVLWPMEIDVSASHGEDPTDIFAVEKIENVYDRQKIAAIDAVMNCKFKEADDTLNELLTAQERFLKLSWAYTVHRDLAEAHRVLAEKEAKPPNCAQDDLRYAWKFERKLRLEAIKHATKLGVEYEIPAMNMWAGYSRRVYLQNKRNWPDLTLRDAFNREEYREYEEYREFLRADVQLVVGKLDKEPVRKLVPNAIAGCLDHGKREALYSFESVLSEPENVNLNRIMNVISGLHRLVMPEWRMGTWVGFPSKDQKGEVEIIRKAVGPEVLDGFNYRLEVTHDPPDGELVPHKMTFKPKDDAPCRFELVEGREAYAILIRENESILKAERSRLTYQQKPEDAESLGG